MLLDQHRAVASGAARLALVALVAGGCDRRAPCATPSSPHTCLVARVTGATPGGELGFRFGEPLDLDGDRVADLAGGARFAGKRGVVQTWGHGRPAAGWESPWPDALYGQGVLAVPDLDGDGRAELIVSAPGARIGGGLGVVEARTPAGQVLWRTASARNDGLGWQLARAGDQDGDGVEDLWAGAPSEPVTSSAYLLSGRDGRVLRRIDSGRHEDAFGWYVVATGDLDGDGKGDVAIGAPYADGRQGAVTVASSTGRVLHELRGELPRSHFGEMLAGLDDLDGDGVPDLAVGAPGSPSAPQARGDVLLFSGKTGKVLRRLGQRAAGELYGRQLAVLDDLDRDGVRDLAIGAPWAGDAALPRAGRLEIRSARGLGLLAELRGAVADGWLGWHVARAGAALPGPGLVVGSLTAAQAAGVLELHAFR